MKYRLSVLNAGAGGLFLFAMIVGALNYQNFTQGEGLGIAAILIVMFVALCGLHLDFALQLFIKNTYALNIIEGIVILTFLLYILYL